MIPASKPWILGTHNFQTVTLVDEGFSGTSRVDDCFPDRLASYGGDRPSTGSTT